MSSIQQNAMCVATPNRPRSVDVVTRIDALVCVGVSRFKDGLYDGLNDGLNGAYPTLPRGKSTRDLAKDSAT